MTWLGIEQRKPEHIGYVYIITHIPTQRFYIGQKKFYFKKTRKPLKGNKNKRHYTTDSDWQDYWGSSNKLLKFIEENGKQDFKREILCFCDTKWELSYMELRYQIKYDVLFNPLAFNEILNVRLHKSK